MKSERAEAGFATVYALPLSAKAQAFNYPASAVKPKPIPQTDMSARALLALILHQRGGDAEAWLVQQAHEGRFEFDGRPVRLDGSIGPHQRIVHNFDDRLIIDFEAEELGRDFDRMPMARRAQLIGGENWIVKFVELRVRPRAQMELLYWTHLTKNNLSVADQAAEDEQLPVRHNLPAKTFVKTPEYMERAVRIARTITDSEHKTWLQKITEAFSRLSGKKFGTIDKALRGVKIPPE